jgi:hypothetical protein
MLVGEGCFDSNPKVLVLRLLVAQGARRATEAALADDASPRDPEQSLSLLEIARDGALREMFDRLGPRTVEPTTGATADR